MNKSTGIVRRVDDLGRIVIPKEIRRIFKVREGDPMEIFVSEEGILIKKYSPLAKLNDFAQEYASSLFESTDHITLVTDLDTIIAVAGGARREYLDKSIGNTVLNCMENRISQLSNDCVEVEIKNDIKEYSSSYVISPIILYGEPIGSVIMLNKDEKVKMGEMEVKMVETAALFLAKQMED
ncbi:stage V sporulation T C-terminal domain-containing protein [Paenibacillus lactis]|uniref:stage V sporulation T C-terminal domain-containing protein n=1 Tax=Paenibacillus lactis TaxID=228574 RepID=UPI003D732DC2